MQKGGESSQCLHIACMLAPTSGGRMSFDGRARPGRVRLNVKEMKR